MAIREDCGRLSTSTIEGYSGATVRTQLVRVIVSLLRRLSRLRGSALTG